MKILLKVLLKLIIVNIIFINNNKKIKRFNKIINKKYNNNMLFISNTKENLNLNLNICNSESNLILNNYKTINKNNNRSSSNYNIIKEQNRNLTNNNINNNSKINLEINKDNNKSNNNTSNNIEIILDKNKKRNNFNVSNIKKNLNKNFILKNKKNLRINTSFNINNIMTNRNMIVNPDIKFINNSIKEIINNRYQNKNINNKIIDKKIEKNSLGIENNIFSPRKATLNSNPILINENNNTNDNTNDNITDNTNGNNNGNNNDSNKIKRKNRTRGQSSLGDVPKLECNICHKYIETYLFKIHINLHPSQIFDWMFLGSYQNACDINELRRNKINYILNCAAECTNINLPKDIIEYHLNIKDEKNFCLFPFFEEANIFINKVRFSGKILLIHCKFGISRSVSLVMAFLIKNFGFNVKNAFNFIKRRREQINPNQGFINQLIDYEKYIKEKKK